MTDSNPYASNQPLQPQAEKVLAVVTQLVPIVFEFFGPLIAYLVLKGRGPFITHHVRESLNFGITMVLVYVILTVSIIGWLFFWVPPIYWTIVRIWAAVKTSEGDFFRYPLTLRLLKG